MLRKTSYVVVLLLVLTSCSSASLRSASFGINAYPALWVVESRNSAARDKKVYLFGSVHSLPAAVKWYGMEIQNAFAASEELVLEAVANESDTKRDIALELEHGFFQDSKRISDYLTYEEYKKYQKIVKALRLDPNKADKMKPWLLFAIINSITNKKNRSFGVDRLFYLEAKKRGLKISALESFNTQISSLAAEPLTEQIKNLKAALNAKGVDKGKQASELLISWMRGDTQKTARLIAKGLSAKVYSSLIIKRNRLWLPRIVSYLHQAHTSMIVVGQAHLIGRDNIIDKLKRRGYKVRRIQ